MAVRYPRVGSFVRIWWHDIEHGIGWEQPEKDGAETIEVSLGIYRGLDKDGRIRVAPTAAVTIKTREIQAVLTELTIPPGCVVKIEKLPKAEL